MHKQHFQMILKGVSVLILFFRYFLPIIAISVLVNVICFHSSMELFLILFWKSILTTIITVLCILYGVKREHNQKQKSKIRLFFWFFLPMIPYLELIAIGWYEHNIVLFIKKTLMYLLSYGVLSCYYTFAKEIKRLSKSAWQIATPKRKQSPKKKKKRSWNSVPFLYWRKIKQSEYLEMQMQALVEFPEKQMQNDFSDDRLWAIGDWFDRWDLGFPEYIKQDHLDFW